MQNKVFAFVLATTRNLEMDTYRFQGREVLASSKYFIGNFIRSRHADNGQAMFGFTVRFVAVEQLNIFYAAFTVEALSSKKSDFHC